MPEVFISTEFPRGTYFKAYLHWKTVRDRLSTAINDYLNACDSLNTLYAVPLDTQIDEFLIETILGLVSKELPSLSTEYEKLVTGRATLSALRNRSKMLCPINSLPSEILANIFELASVSCVRDTSGNQKPLSVCPAVFASVSTRWRRIALNKCRLWSHIDLVATCNPDHKLFRRANIWISRAKSAPLHIHVHQRAAVKPDDIAQLSRFLAPHMKQICTLHAAAECHSLDLFESVLASWIDFGLPGSTKSLVMHRPAPIPLLARHEPDCLQQLHTRYLPEQINALFQPLCKLHLRNVCVGWGTSLYQGLSELHLESLLDFVSPTIGELVAALRSSPALYSLKLARVSLRIENQVDGGEIEPARLDNLQLLNLVETSSVVMKHLLPLIAPGAMPMSMSIGLDTQEPFQDEINYFFERSNVCQLYIDVRRQNWFPTLFESAKSLKRLALRNYRLDRAVFSGPESSPETSPEEAFHELGICARLHSLSFIGCELDRALLQGILTGHSNSLRSLEIWRSKLLGQGDGMLELVSEQIPWIKLSSQLEDYPVVDWAVCDEHDGNSVPVPL